MTISEQAATELAASVAPVPGGQLDPVSREAAERMLNYLIFHRSLLGESDAAPALLERYLTLVRDMKEGVHIVIADPYQKATAMLFELVMDEAFDPWEIDLARFTEAYLERVRSQGGVDFAVAGRLLYMAWSILYLQSKELLQNRAVPASPLGDPADPSATLATLDDGYLGALGTPEAVDVTTAVLGETQDPALVQMVRHPETRPVSLLELVHAFGNAEEDARRSLRIQELRERLREEQRAAPEVLVHGDIPERDLVDVWEVSLRHPAHVAFPITELWREAEGRDRLVSVFLALLFLARERVVELRQESLGESPLLLVRIADARPERVPEA
ncbi:MAG TPA: segregation/condensation protein A [Thermoplasmata archaeon]|nr:segregation/condensation protein A [Thermoplasmata archaeon]